MKRLKFEDFAINSTAKKKPVESDKYTYLGLENLDPGTLKVTRFGSDVAPIGEKLLMKKGDVLFGKRRAYQKKVAIAPFDGIFSAHGMVLRPKLEYMDKDFFPLFISSDYFLDQAIKISVGSLSPTINWRDLRVLEFNIPELKKQVSMAKILWSIINTIESYKELVKKTDDLVAARFLEVSKKGEFKSLKIASICEPFASDLLINKLENNNGDYPLYGATGLVKGIDFYRMDKPYISIIKWGAGVGRVDVHEAKSSIVGSLQGINAMGGIDLIWLSYALKSIDLASYATNTTVPNLYFKDYGEAVVNVPNITIQKGFAEFAIQCEASKNKLLKTINELNLTYKKIIKDFLEED